MAFDLSDPKRDESLRILSDAKLPNLMPLYHRYGQAQAMQLGRDIERSILVRPITLYDQFGRAIFSVEGANFQEGRLPEGATLTTYPPFPPAN